MGLTQALVIAMLYFASQVSGLPIPLDAHPVVGIAKINPMLAGETERTDGSIKLQLGWRNDTEGKCVLAHELTHWLQFHNGGLGRDHEVEPPAYRVGASCYRMYRRFDLEAWSLQQAREHAAKLD